MRSIIFNQHNINNSKNRYFKFPGDSMMYQHSVSGVGCSGNSPTTSTPPNINTCSSTTPPLSSNQQNPSQNEGSNEQMV